VVPLLDAHESLVVVKTFSKAWSLAGVRLGYLLAAPSLVAELARVRLPYHLSTPTQLFGEAALDHTADMRTAVRSLVEERARVEAGLRDLEITVHPSSANFVLFEVDDPQSVWDALLERGVLVRNYSGAPGLERCLRVTAGLPEETDAFLAAMKEVA
jgi:histidinol-phosphate aminotransferase